ncbi:MAG: ABC transporter substrate-binding protein [Patescibacteria group bacterium]
MKKITYTIIVLLIIIGGYFVFYKKQAESNAIKIGVASLLTGDYSVVGENIRDTATLFVDNINAKGGINGKKIELTIEDSKTDSKSGLDAVSKLINVDGDTYIIAGMTSNGTIAAAPLANQNKVPLLTPVTGGKNVDDAGEYIFRMANSDSLAGRDIARGMAKLGYKKVAVVSEVTDYTLSIRDAFVTEAANQGETLVLNEQFQPDTIDLRSIVSKAKSASPDAILILSQTGISGAQFIKQSKEQGINASFFSDFTLVTNGDAKKIVGTFDGVYFADPAYNADNSNLQNFFAEYTQKYGHAPAIPFHTASTYDSLELLVKAISAVGDNSQKVHDWLLVNVKNYQGFMGTYSLDANGNSDLGFTIKKVVGDKNIPI